MFADYLSLPTLLGWIAVLAVAWTAFYRVKLHPLSKYPGPLLAKVTDLYSVYHALNGNVCHRVYDLHQKHGDIIRIGPNRVSICNASGWKTIYGFNANVRKPDWYRVFGLAFDVENVFSMLNNNSEQASRRKVIGQMFSPSGMQNLQPHIIRNADKFCEKLNDAKKPGEWSSPRDMTKWFSYVKLDIMCDLCFSRNFGLIDSERNRDLLQAFMDGAGAINVISYMSWILGLKSDWSFVKKYIAGARRFNQVTKEIAKERFSDHEKFIKQHDAMEILLNSKKPSGEAFELPDITSEAGLLLVAGSDSSKVGIVSTLWYLLHYPDTLKKLQSEVRDTFDTTDEIQMGPKLQSCRYLRACIEEGIRLTPSFPGLIMRQILPGGLVIDGEYLPASTELGAPVWVLHRDERYHPDPLAFKPTRWIVGDGVTKEDVAREQSAFLPFGFGPRACTGRNMAYAEISIVLARMIFQFDFRLSETGDGEKINEKRIARPGVEGKPELDIFDNFLAVTEGPVVEFKRR